MLLDHTVRATGLGRDSAVDDNASAAQAVLLRDNVRPGMEALLGQPMVSRPTRDCGCRRAGGYRLHLPIADERARTLLLGNTNKAARLSVCCGGATQRLEQEFREHGFARVERIATTFEEFLKMAEPQDLRAMGQDGRALRE
jgi:hypothetical protein